MVRGPRLNISLYCSGGIRDRQVGAERHVYRGAVCCRSPQDKHTQRGADASKPCPAHARCRYEVPSIAIRPKTAQLYGASRTCAVAAGRSGPSVTDCCFPTVLLLTVVLLTSGVNSQQGENLLAHVKQAPLHVAARSLPPHFCAIAMYQWQHASGNARAAVHKPAVLTLMSLPTPPNPPLSTG